KSETLARSLFAEPQRLEQARLHVLEMNSYAAGTKLDAVEHQIVTLRAAFPGRGFQLVEVFLDDPRERMLRTHPALVALAPRKEREAGDPGEFPFGTINQIELVTHVKANLARNI